MNFIIIMTIFIIITIYINLIIPSIRIRLVIFIPFPKPRSILMSNLSFFM